MTAIEFYEPVLAAGGFIGAWAVAMLTVLVFSKAA